MSTIREITMAAAMDTAIRRLSILEEKLASNARPGHVAYLTKEAAAREVASIRGDLANMLVAIMPR